MSGDCKMDFMIQNHTLTRQYLQNLQFYAEKHPLCAVKYLILGNKTIRLLCRTPEILPHIEKQLTFSRCDTAQNFDATLVIWKETDTDSLIKNLSPNFNPLKNPRMHLEKLMSQSKRLSLSIFDKNFSNHIPLININGDSSVVEAIDPENQTWYYAVANLEPEELIKQGHLFVQQFNNILKLPQTNLVHGAVVGLKNKGVLFCARGQRGKSTLTVLSMMEGFDYVSDDYLILDNNNNSLQASPIYSIITLSPRMYNELYDDLKGKFVSNNARKDKYVINIAAYHNQFKTHYPIKLCIFPEIVSQAEPRIYECSGADKGRAIVQLIHSTVMQMRDLNDRDVIQKLLNFIKDLPFYKLELCPDIKKNTAFLRKFLDSWKPCIQKIKTPRIMTDITFNLANILDAQTCTLYSMNKFTSNLYENLLKGVSVANLRQNLEANDILPQNFDLFLEVLKKKSFWEEKKFTALPEINLTFAREDKCKLSIVEYAATGHIELIKKGEKNEQLCA